VWQAGRGSSELSRGLVRTRDDHRKRRTRPRNAQEPCSSERCVLFVAALGPETISNVSGTGQRSTFLPVRGSDRGPPCPAPRPAGEGAVAASPPKASMRETALVA